MLKQSVPKSYLPEVSDPLAAITQANFHVRLFHNLKYLFKSNQFFRVLSKPPRAPKRKRPLKCFEALSRHIPLDRLASPKHHRTPKTH